MTNPFAALGLEQRADLTDDEVRAAWRRTASATHPDRDDGGDPRQFGEAAAAYTVLRTRFGRGEAMADLGGDRPGGRGSRRGGSVMDELSAEGQGAARLLTRVRQGRPGRLALRTLAAVAASVAAVAAAGPHPAAPALVTGVATWLVLTARHDLA